MTRDNATSRARGIAGCLVVVSAWTKTAAPGVGTPAFGRAENPAPAWSLAAALLGFFVVTLDAVIVNVALPDIRRELGVAVAAAAVSVLARPSAESTERTRT